MAEAVAAEAAARLIRRKNNELTAGYFAVSVLGFMTVFTIIHYSDRYLEKSLLSNGPVSAMTSSLRWVRSKLLQKVRGFPSFGHLLVFVLYLMINIVLTFHTMDYPTLVPLAKRFGWVAASNIALITVLALKNTPLAFLTSYSYERLNVLHQAAGYVTIFWTVMHGVLYVIALHLNGGLAELRYKNQIYGIVAGVSMILIFFTATFIRSKYYEIFYALHMSLFMLILVMLGMHRSNIDQKTIYIVFFASSVWVLDRLFRTAKIVTNFFGNSVTLTPLPHNAVRVVVKRTPWRTVPGSHCFISIPAIRGFETHPFTVVNTNPLEFVVSAHDGFTKDLRDMAVRQSSQEIQLRCSVDGPYGTLPVWMDFDKIILVAGGSGGTFAFGVANDILNQISSPKFSGRIPQVHLVWVVRDLEQLNWFAANLHTVLASPHVTNYIHVTGHTHGPSLISHTDTYRGYDSNAIVTNNDLERQNSIASTLNTGATLSLPVPHTGGHAKSMHKPSMQDIEKSMSAVTATDTMMNTLAGVPGDLEIHGGRPDVYVLVKGVIEMGKGEIVRSKKIEHDSPEVNNDAGVGAKIDHGEGTRTVVAACGPPSMISDVRRCVIEEVGGGAAGGSVRLHLESFGW